MVLNFSLLGYKVRDVDLIFEQLVRHLINRVNLYSLAVVFRRVVLSSLALQHFLPEVDRYFDDIVDCFPVLHRTWTCGSLNK